MENNHHNNKEKDTNHSVSACARLTCPCADEVACPSLAGYTCQ